MNHYLCHRLWFPATNAERIVQTLKWFPAYNIKMPIASRDALIIAAAQELTAALTATDHDSLLPTLETVTRQNLQKLSKIFGNTTTDQTPPKGTADTPVSNPAQLPRVTAPPITPQKKQIHPARPPRVAPKLAQPQKKIAHPVPLPRVIPPKLRPRKSPQVRPITNPATTYASALHALITKSSKQKKIIAIEKRRSTRKIPKLSQPKPTPTTASVNQKEKRTQGLLHHLRSMPGHRRPIRIQTPHRGPQQALLAQRMLQRSRTPRSRKPTGRYPRH